MSERREVGRWRKKAILAQGHAEGQAETIRRLRGQNATLRRQLTEERTIAATAAKDIEEAERWLFALSRGTSLYQQGVGPIKEPTRQAAYAHAKTASALAFLRGKAGITGEKDPWYLLERLREKYRTLREQARITQGGAQDDR